jgi:hypothetical protein
VSALLESAERIGYVLNVLFALAVIGWLITADLGAFVWLGAG